MEPNSFIHSFNLFLLPFLSFNSIIHSPTDWYPILAHRIVMQQYLYSTMIEIYVQGLLLLLVLLLSGREMQMPCHCRAARGFRRETATDVVVLVTAAALKSYHSIDS